MIHELIEQGSPEWLALRCGKATGSRVADALKKNKDGKYAASRIDYAYDLALERLTGEPQGPDLSNVRWVQDGKEWEADARSLYEFLTDNEVRQIGFATHDTIELFGASPDGLVGEDGVLEIKCPKAKTHLGYLLAKEPPFDYLYQMDAEMACTGRKWCDFVSFNPKSPPNLQYFCTRYYRDEARIKALEAGVIEFLSEVAAITESVRKADKS